MQNDNARLEAIRQMLKSKGLDVKGMDANYLDRVFGADTPTGPMSTMQLTLKALMGETLDVPVYSADQVNLVALPAQIVFPVVSKYTFAVRYFCSSPSMLRMIQIMSSELNTGAPQLGSMVITPTRKTPFGMVASDEVLVQSFKTPGDFQSNQAVVGLNGRMDGYSYLAFSTAVPAPADTTFSLIFYFSQRIEARDALPTQAAQVTLAPGGVPMNAQELARR